MFKALTPDISVAAQIALDDCAQAAADGFVAIICNRPDGEDSGQPDAADVRAAAAAGLHFAHIPVDASGLNAELVEAMAAEIGAARDRGGPILAYCRSGTRSTNLWALAEASRGGNPEAIVAAAARGGYNVAPMLPMLKRLAGQS